MFISCFIVILFRAFNLFTGSFFVFGNLCIWKSSTLRDYFFILRFEYFIIICLNGFIWVSMLIVDPFLIRKFCDFLQLFYAWVAQLVEHLTLDFSSGHDLGVVRSSPRSISELSLLGIRSLPLPLPLLLFSLSLSLK